MKRFLSVLLVMCIMISGFLINYKTEVYAGSGVGGQTLSLGIDSSAVIKNDGSLWMWGKKGYAFPWQDDDNKYIPKKVMDDVKFVSVGMSNCAVIKKDGSLWTWGIGYYGNVGDGTYEFETDTPVKILDNVSFVDVGYRHSAAITEDCTLWMWGDNEHGQLGDGTNDKKNTPIKIMENVKSVGVGEICTAAVKNDGSLWTWGNGYLGDGNYSQRNTPERIMRGVETVSVSDHMAAIKEDGSLWMWGANDYGQVGNGTTMSVFEPIKIMEDVKIVSAKHMQSMVVKTDGSLWIWGLNNYNHPDEKMQSFKSGITENVYISKPMWIMDNVLTGDVGFMHRAAVKEDGSLWLWGLNSGGALGDGTTEYRHTPVKIMDDIITIKKSNMSDWAKEEIEEAEKEGLVPEVLKGKDLRQKVDRAEFAAIAVALYEKLTGSTTYTTSNPFNDIGNNDCYDEILKAYNLDITIGTSDVTFSPDMNITREQMATMLTRTYKKSEFDGWTIETDSDYVLSANGVKKFADDAEISDYAKESVYFMAKYGIIEGVGNNRFAPKNNSTMEEAYGYATREQAIVVALRNYKLVKLNGGEGVELVGFDL